MVVDDLASLKDHRGIASGHLFLDDGFLEFFDRVEIGVGQIERGKRESDEEVLHVRICRGRGSGKQRSD